MADDVLKVRLSAEGLQEVMDALKKTAAGTEKVGKAGQATRDALGSLGTLLAAQQLASFARNAIEVADGLGKMAQKTGATVENLSVLTFMGQQADLSNQDLEKGLVKLGRSMVDLKSGLTTAVQGFAQIGLSAKDFEGLSLDQALIKVANAQARFADGGNKAGTMMQILGRSGASMIPLLNDLANGGFENAKKKLQELGLVITGDMAKSSQDFNDSMKRMEMAAQGVTIQVAQTMLPGLTRAIDGLTAALAGMPSGAKIFSGSFLLVGSAATATAVAVRALSAAFVGLGPAGIALVAISALVAGIVALKGAQDEEDAAALKSIQDRGTLARQGQTLENAYRRESAALAKSTGNKQESQKHSAKLKEIEDQLIALSPDLQKTLSDETKGYKEKADAIKQAREQAQQSLQMEKAELTQQLQTAQSNLARLEAEAAKVPEITASMAKVGTPEVERAQAALEATKDAMVRWKQRLQEIDKALGTSAPGASDPTKPLINVEDPQFHKAEAAAATALAKRMAAEQKSQVDAYAALTEDFYKQGLIDLNTYLAARRTAIVRAAQIEVASLEQQIKGEEAARTSSWTASDRMASETRVADLKAQIARTQEQAQLKLDALERTGRDEREKNTEEALKLEAELAAAKGQTGEAGIRAIEAEYARRIALAKSPEARAALQGLQGQAVGASRIGNTQKALDLGQRSLTAELNAVDLQRSQGTLTEEEAIQRKMALYRQLLPLLQAAADEQMRLAQLTGNPEDLIKAKENANGVEQLKADLKSLGDQMDWVKSTARDAFESGLGNLLATLTDQTTSLTDKVLALGQAIAQAMLQQASARIAASITSAIFGPAPGHAEGGYITGPGTSTSDSIPALLSNQEYVVKAAAVRRYGVGYLDALNGMRLPKGSLPGFADGGLVGSPSGGGMAALPAPRVRVIVVSNEREAMESLMNGPAGEQAVLQHIHRNPDALRG